MVDVVDLTGEPDVIDLEKTPILTYIIVYACNTRQYTSKGSFLFD